MNAKTKHFTVIGAGAAGLAAAATLAQKGHRVTVLEKNSTVGGRGRVFQERGYTFDMGPSWYWMPDVFEGFFSRFGRSSSDFYELVRLDPAFRIIFGPSDILDVPGTEDGLLSMLERIEPGSGVRARRFFDEGRLKYEIGVRSLAFKPARSITEFIDRKLITNLHKLHLLKRFDRYVRSFFTDPRLIQLMEFPILFLGTLPSTTPAMYSFMNYGGFIGGTWYPKKGMHEIAIALKSVAQAQGATINTGAEVQGLVTSNGSKGIVKELLVGDERIATDGVVAAADYSHVDSKLLPQQHRRYSERYWRSRVLAPSSLIIYLGINRRVPNLLHHNLFFDADFSKHAAQLTTKPTWPDDPLFYVSCPSKTDSTVAPEGCENLFVLVPIASWLDDSDEQRATIRAKVLARLEAHTGISLTGCIEYERMYCSRDFVADYHALGGNAYGLANTLLQTAIGKPEMVSRKLSNLVYAGQLTVPGPGLPPSLISGQVAADMLHKRNGA